MGWENLTVNLGNLLVGHGNCDITETCPLQPAIGCEKLVA